MVTTMNGNHYFKIILLEIYLFHTSQTTQFGNNPDGIPTMDPSLKHLIAWNCDLKDSLQFSEYSLMKVETCANISSQYKSPITKKGQVIQAKRYEDMSVLECKLVASFFTAYCSYNLISGYRLWDSQGQLMNINVQLSKSECEKALKTNTLRYTDRTYYAKQNFLSIDLSPAYTADGWLTLRGTSNPIEGTCVPESFSLGRNLYPSHILTMQYEVKIKRLHAVFNTEKRLIRINEHIVLPNTLTGSYFSPSLGNYHWEQIDQGNLTDNHWLQIAVGTVKMYYPTKLNSSMPIAIMETNQTGASLAFSLKEQTNLCLSYSCRQAHKTQLKDVYLVIYNDVGQSQWSLDEVTGSEVNRLLNLEASLASVYLSKELRLTSTFEKISRELCQRNREIILSNIQDYINNVLIQQDTKEAQGRFFVRAGSVLYAIKCNEQVAWLRGNTTECHEHAPIFYKDKYDNIKSAFIDPITYVIQPSSNIKPCNDILPFKFNLMALDGTSEWICRTSQGWNVDCKRPNTLSPMHPGTLYVADDKTILSNLYSQPQLDSLEEMQWEKTERKVELKEWETYLQKVKANNPDISTVTYFENLKKAIDNVSDIFSGTFWVKLAIKHVMPLVFMNYMFNVLLNMIKAIMFIKRTYKSDGFTISLFAKACISFIASFFPVFALSTFNSSRPKKCNCETEEFIDDLVRTIEERERQRFLRNLQL